MKAFIIKTIMAIICLTATTSCKAQKIFSELSSDPDVESIFVGKAMMTLAKGVIHFDGDNEAMKAIKGINSVEIINCEKPDAINRIRTKAHKIIKSRKLELLLENKDGKEMSNIYGRVPDNDKDSYISNIVIENIEPDEYNLIHINGKIDLKALMLMKDD